MTHHIKMLVAALLFVSCATPMAPSGGPPDKTGPSVTEMYPQSGTINFKDNSFEFEFSEFVNRASFVKSLTIEPDLGLQYDIKWKRKKAIVSFKNDLPDSTTIILTLGVDVADTRNNKMGTPVKLAISTGDEIDKGEIIGRIKNAKDGKSKVGQRVLLYRQPIDFSKKATYIAETDTGGVFRFNYLRDGKYQAIMINDRNQNKIWEKETETGLPFNREWIELEDDGADTLDVAYWFEADTLKPELQAVGLLSSQKLRLRFSEEIKFTDATNIQITDSLKNVFSEVIPLNISAQDPFIAFAFSLEALHQDSSYWIAIQGITDFSGNEAVGLEKSFKGSGQADTTQQRILTSNSRFGLLSTQAFEVEYAAPLTDPEILDSIVVVEGDVSFDDWPGITFENNKVTVPPQEKWIEGIDYQFMMWNPAQNKRQLFKPETWDPVDFGGIEVNVLSVDSTKVYNLSIVSTDEAFRIDTTFSGSYTLENIRSVPYTLTVYEDVNNNGKWDFGAIVPFVAPEPYYIQKDIKVQKGFTSEIIINFN